MLPLPQARTRKPHRLLFPGGRRIGALILREMVTTYGRNPGGYIWAVLEPALGIALLTLVFSLTFASPALGRNFPIFYATGLLPFLMFVEITNKLSQSINFSRPLLTYPKVNVVYALLARFILATITQLMVVYILLIGIMLCWDTQLVPDLPRVTETYAVVALLALGMGTLNCYLTTRFPIYQRIWSIIMRPMFLLCGAVFLFDAIPDRFQNILWYNPLVHVVGMSRQAFYASYAGEYVSPLYVYLFSLTTLLIGLLLIRREEHFLINER
ncbi:Polysialic acid transport protein KpsM [Aquimixticola soesokkakensis]|uniref:Transport permease protein n=1 Tax=Aquimixticola soesokkakensis TaxID=1519096 RepID=A0A1Y5REN3_9RHOB|nr:ABC transporter permease [Aquimixticola soesokkakensis]SLN15352.1 Polysialic acid transport protein KpsM [Aquimixticola soesokkakensis]